MVFIGLEAEDENALKEIHKQLNVKRGVDGYAQVFRRIHRAGIAVLGAFIFGMDSDTVELLRRRANYMIHSGVDVMQSTFLTPLPGTRLFERYYKEGRLLYTDFPRDWDHYGMTEVIHRPEKIEAKQLGQVMGDLNRQTHSWPVLLRKVWATFWRTRNLTATMFSWNSNLNYRNVGRGRVK
jgi:radical SAM superfamily enzyme YgiQ (UPF0313 family)